MRPSAHDSSPAHSRPARRPPRRRLTAFAARLLAAGALGSGVLVAGSALTVQQGCAEKPPPARAPEPIVIGVSLGLTGNFQDFAAPLRSAIVVAEGEINANGGLLARPVRYEVIDDQSSEREDIEAVAQGFVDRGVAAVIGPLGSSQVVRTQQILFDNQVLQISPSATSTELTGIQPAGDRFLFRTTPADDFQGAAVILLAQRTPRALGDGGAPATGDGGAPVTCQRLAIVNIDNSYGNPMADLVEQFWPRRAGRAVTIRTKISKDLAADYRSEVRQVIATNPECLAFIAYDDVAAQFLRDFRADSGFAALGNDFFIIGTDGIYTEGLLRNGAENPADLTSTNVAEGVFGTNPDTQSGSKEYNEFRTLYDSYFPLGGRDAPSFAANAYDAAILAALAIQRAGTATDRRAIRDALRDVAQPPGRPVTPAQIGEGLRAARSGEAIDYKGASGNLDFDETGDVTAGFIVWEAARDPESRELVFRTVGRFSVEELVEQIN
jgi:branched-chain amino acid transport system substrate-binding protein